jgi:hypothetical protein
MEKLDQHMERQDLSMEQLKQQLKSGSSQDHATSSEETRPVRENFISALLLPYFFLVCL